MARSLYSILSIKTGNYCPNEVLDLQPQLDFFFSLAFLIPQFWLLKNFDRHSEQYSFRSIHFQNMHTRFILQSLPLTTALAEI